MQFKLDLKDNAGDIGNTRTTIINGSHSLIKHMVVKSAGKIVYDTDNLYLVTFAKNLLEYLDDYARSVAKNSLWYLDLADSTVAAANVNFEARRLLTRGVANDGTGAGKEVNVTILINRYSFFEALEGQLLPPMQLTIELELTPDTEVLYGAADTARLIINRFCLWVPRLEPKDALISKFVSELQKPSKWTDLRELYESSDVFRNSGDFRISPSIDKVKHVFIYAQREKTNSMTENPYIFDTVKLNAADNDSTISTCRLEYGNGTFYPEYAYESDSKSRIFSDLMNYSWKKNDYIILVLN